MGTEFKASAAQSVARQGIEMGAVAGMSSDCAHLISKNGTEMAAVAGFSAPAPDREMFPYKPFGRPVVRTIYHVELLDHNERLKWSDDFENLVTSVGLDKILDAVFKTGLASPAWFIGLVSNSPEPSYLPADTMLSHANWNECAKYAEETRPAFVPGTISAASVDNISSRAVFNINGVDTIAGCFLADDDEISGTDGLLYGVGTFTGGPRDVEDGDILRVAATITIAASVE